MYCSVFSKWFSLLEASTSLVKEVLITKIYLQETPLVALNDDVSFTTWSFLTNKQSKFGASRSLFEGTKILSNLLAIWAQWLFNDQLFMSIFEFFLPLFLDIWSEIRIFRFGIHNSFYLMHHPQLKVKEWKLVSDWNPKSSHVVAVCWKGLSPKDVTSPYCYLDCYLDWGLGEWGNGTLSHKNRLSMGQQFIPQHVHANTTFKCKLWSNTNLIIPYHWIVAIVDSVQ